MPRPAYNEELINSYPPRLELTDDERDSGVVRRFGWAFKPDALVQYLKTKTDESFNVPINFREIFDGKERYHFKDLTEEQHVDRDCKLVFMSDLAGRVATYWTEHYNVQEFPFTPVSHKYHMGISVWNTIIERGFRMVYGRRLEPMMAELNGIFGGPNFESTEAMWWRALQDIERERSITWIPV